MADWKFCAIIWENLLASTLDSIHFSISVKIISNYRRRHPIMNTRGLKLLKVVTGLQTSCSKVVIKSISGCFCTVCSQL
jgi:hypothetical protein